MDNVEPNDTKPKNRRGISILSIVSVIFLVPATLIFILDFATGENVPLWIVIILGVISAAIGIVDIEIGHCKADRQLRFLSVLSIVLATISISVAIVFTAASCYINQIGSLFTTSISQESNTDNADAEKDSETEQEEKQENKAETEKGSETEQEKKQEKKKTTKKKKKDTSPKTITAKVGGGITYGNAKVSFTNCYEYTDYDEWTAPKAGYKVVVFEFEVENGNSSNFNFGSYGFEGYADNVKVEPYYYMDSDIELNLAPGRTGTGTVAFEVPEDAQSIQADYDFGGNNIAVFVYGE